MSVLLEEVKEGFLLEFKKGLEALLVKVNAALVKESGVPAEPAPPTEEPPPAAPVAEPAASPPESAPAEPAKPAD